MCALIRTLEVLDFGYPQIMEVDVLRKYITQGNTKNLNLNVRREKVMDNRLI